MKNTPVNAAKLSIQYNQGATESPPLVWVFLPRPLLGRVDL